MLPSTAAVFLVYNVHGLLHLADDARRFGASVFPFENFLGQLKRKAQNPIAQIVRRVVEMHNVTVTCSCRNSRDICQENSQQRTFARGHLQLSTVSAVRKK